MAECLKAPNSVTCSTVAKSSGRGSSSWGHHFRLPAVILAFIGVKLILHWAHVDISASVPEVPTPLSLGVIIGILVIVTVASLIKTRNDPSAKAHPGSLRGHREDEKA